MKRIITIISDYTELRPDMIETGCGGSETWAIELSKQFAANDYVVLIFSTYDMYINNGPIQFIPIKLLDFVLSHTKVDYFIIFRYILSNTVNILSKYVNKNLYTVAHDIYIMLDWKILTYEKMQEIPLYKDHLQKIIVMSDFAKEILQQYTNIPSNKIEIIGNGIAFNDIYKNDNRDNNIFWSSRHERGLKELTFDILPILKKTYPDMKIYVAQYENSLPQEYLDNPDIVFLGKLNKDELYKEMSKHKVYFYPNVFKETFCITILEAILCDNELITVNRHGPATTLKLFDCLMLPDTIELEPQKCANMIIDKIENYNNQDRINMRKIMKKYILTEFSWEKICEKFMQKILI